jgi:predicted phage tail protein
MRTHLPLTALLIFLSAQLLHGAAPSPPQNLTASVSGDSVTLNWAPPSAPGGVLFGYIIQASLSPGGAIVAAFADNDTTLVVTDVPAGVYYVRVLAANAEGNSAPSNEVMVVVEAEPPCTSAPNAPANLGSTVSGDLVTLNWTAPATGCAVTGYAVVAGSAPGLADLAVINVGAVTSLSVTAPAGTYFVRVVSLNSFGMSPASNEITVVSTGPCNTPPSAPSNLTAQMLGNVVTLNWTAAAGGCPPAGFVVQAGSASGASDVALVDVGAATSLTVAAPPGTYYVRVMARNAFGNGGVSNEVTVSVTETVADVSGTWSGTSTYFNAPFTFNLTQSGNTVGGSYQDQHDVGSATGTVDGANVVINVWFGDTGTRFTGTIEAPNRIRGIIHGGPIGGPYPFQMTR